MRPTMVSRAILASPFVLVFIGAYVLFVLIEPGQRADARAFSAMTPLYEQVGEVSVTLRVMLPLAVTGCAAAAIVWAVSRGRWREGATAVIAVIVAAALAGPLKASVLSRPYHGDFIYTENTFPSGHTAISITSAACCVWLLRSRRRWVTALVVFSSLLLGIAASIAQLTSYAHRFSDVVGGIMLSGAVISACFAGPRALRSLAVMVTHVLLLLAAAGAIWLGCGPSVDDSNAARLVFATVAATIGAVMMVPLARGSTVPAAARRRSKRRDFDPLDGSGVGTVRA